MRWFLAAAVLLAGCAASPARPTKCSFGPCPAVPPRCGSGPCDAQDTDDVYALLRSLDTEFRTVDAQPAEPDCIKVNTLRAKIWALAILICQIADQQPAGSPTHERCRDSKARAEKAFERAEARGCGKK